MYHKFGIDILQHVPSRKLRVSTTTQGHLQHLCDVSKSILSPGGGGALQPNPHASYCGMLGSLKLGTWTLAAQLRSFRGSFS